MLALVAFRWVGRDRSPGADARGAPPTGYAEGESQHRNRGRQRPGRDARPRPRVRPATSSGEPTFPSTLDPSRSGTLPRCPRACCKSVNCRVKCHSAHRYGPKIRYCAIWRPDFCHFEGFRLPIRWISRAIGVLQQACI